MKRKVNCHICGKKGTNKKRKNYCDTPLFECKECGITWDAYIIGESVTKEWKEKEINKVNIGGIEITTETKFLINYNPEKIIKVER